MTLKLAATACAAIAAVTLSTSVMAGTAVGVGLSWTFGGPKPVSGAALGVKVFSTDKQERGAGYLGLDYSFADRGIRPNLGVAYLTKHKGYVGADMGYSFKQQGLDFGVGVGYVDSKKKR